MFASILLNLIFFFLPTQLGLHFWPGFSYVAGFRIDYLSPTLYFNDLLLLIYVLLNTKKIFSFFKKYSKIVLILFIPIFINVLFSISPLNTVFWFLHLFLYLLFVLSLKLNKISFDRVYPPLILSTFLIIILELLQLLNQGSLGGALYWFGERSFNLGTPNIAKIDILGRQYLRPYATFSHPNSLAGYLFLILLLLIRFKKKAWIKATIIFGILITLSKSVIAVLLITYLGIKTEFILIFSLITTLIPLTPLPSKFIDLPNYIADRWYYGDLAKKIITKYPIFGVGYGNYVSAVPLVLPLRYFSVSKFQPVHNLTLVAITEFGFLNLAVILVYIKKKLAKFINTSSLHYFSLILFITCFDHYFWTLPQNKIILLISILYIV